MPTRNQRHQQAVQVLPGPLWTSLIAFESCFFLLGKDRQAVLYEDFVNCGGNWSRSVVYQQITSSSKDLKQGVRRWITYAQMMEIFKDKHVVDSIICRKEADPETRSTQIRSHPETDRLLQYLVLVEDSEVAESEHTIADLFKARDHGHGNDATSSSDDDASEDPTPKKAGNPKASSVDCLRLLVVM